MKKAFASPRRYGGNSRTGTKAKQASSLLYSIEQLAPPTANTEAVPIQAIASPIDNGSSKVQPEVLD